MLGRHLLKSWSSTQPLVSLSSGEAEFHGVVKAAGVGLGFQSLLEDLGLHLALRAWTDSTASMGICNRQGLGRIRHLATQALWVQQRVRDGSFTLHKVRGEENPADLFTKHITSRERVEHLLTMFGCSFRGGRAEAAPALRQAEGTTKGELLTIADAIPVAQMVADLPAEVRVCWEGRTFPRASEEGMGHLPDAHPCREGLLPHLHRDRAERFPRAVAAAPDEGEDMEEDMTLEEIGRSRGQNNSEKPSRACRSTRR